MWEVVLGRLRGEFRWMVDGDGGCGAVWRKCYLMEEVVVGEVFVWMILFEGCL